MKQVMVKVPATSANLGPGFDCLGMALGLFNEFDFALIEQGLEIVVEGEGAELIPTTPNNLMVQAACRLCQLVGRELPPLRILQRNFVPVASGLGSSSTAVVAGLLGINALLELGFSKQQLLEIATEIEGHPDNVAPALFGGLVLVPMGTKPLHVEHFHIKPLMATIILPEFELLTATARAALPTQLGRADIIFNLARLPLVIRAFEEGNYHKLHIAMQDKIHQPYRIPLVPGMAEAMEAAHKAGAAAVAISGAGPSIIAFSAQNQEAIGRAAQEAFGRVGLASRVWVLPVDTQGSQVKEIA